MSRKNEYRMLVFQIGNIEQAVKSCEKHFNFALIIILQQIY